MALGPLKTVVTYCRSFFGARFDSESDGQLLARYASARDHAAFEQLLERHGAMVLGVCRRVLRDAHAAEDAFQATFLVLVRRAAALDHRASVAGWLYTVAYHISLKLKASADRSVPVAEVAAVSGQDPADDAAKRELRPILDEELSGLPEKYRAPLVLCYLQEKTNEEAARLLGWPVGTVSGRLARARALLGKRLARRGVTLGAAPAAVATVPPALAKTTATTAANPPAGTPVAALVDETTRQTAWARVKKVALAALVASVILCTAAALIIPRLLRDPETPQHPTVHATPGDEEAEGLPSVVVQTHFPGANAVAVADSVAGPIEAAFKGFEGMKQMTSLCDNNGGYTLTVAFAAGTDLDRALTLVQKRISWAEAALPEEVKRQGIVTKKKPGDVLLFIVLQSDGKHDTLYLSNYATLKLKEKLESVPGVGEVLHLGIRNYSMRVPSTWVLLDPERLAARDLTATDVVRVLREQNMRVGAGEFQMPLLTPKQLTDKPASRLEDADQLQNLVLKVDKEGAKTLLKDVGNVDPGPKGDDFGVRYKGKPAVALSVAPAAGAKASEVGPAVRALVAELASNAPPGVRLEAIFDRSRHEKPLRVDVTLMDGASLERTVAALQKCERLLTEMDGVGPVLALTGQPFPLSNQGRLFIGLTPAGDAQREQVAAAIRNRLNQGILEALVQLGDLAPPRRPSSDGRAVVLAVHGGDDMRVLRGTAEALADALTKSGKFTDVGLGPGSREAPSFHFEVDRDRARARDVALSDIYDTLQVHLGSAYVNDFNAFGRNWQVIVKLQEKWRSRPEDIAALKVRNSKGEWVPLESVLDARPRTEPTTQQRFNGRPMIVVTANLLPEVSVAQGRAICDAAAREVLPMGIDLDWLHEKAAKGKGD